MMLREILLPSRKDKKFLDLAYKVAQSSDCNQRHGSVIVKSGRVMAVGVNKVRNNPRFVETDTAPGLRGTIFSVHSEIDALSRVADPRGAILYVARVSKLGYPAFSRPCSECTKTLIRSGIKAISYT